MCLLALPAISPPSTQSSKVSRINQRKRLECFGSAGRTSRCRARLGTIFGRLSSDEHWNIGKLFLLSWDFTIIHGDFTDFTVIINKEVTYGRYRLKKDDRLMVDFFWLSKAGTINAGDIYSIIDIVFFLGDKALRVQSFIIKDGDRSDQWWLVEDSFWRLFTPPCTYWRSSWSMDWE